MAAQGGSSPGLRVSGAALHGVRRGPVFEILVDGAPVVAYEGETIATALLGSGQIAFRRTAKRGAPRGLFCGMGVCFDCLVTVDGVPNVRSCVTPARPGMRVSRPGFEGEHDGTPD
jgi:predicted molibdopterin-dependent oxidoreductase YjgC